MRKRPSNYTSFLSRLAFRAPGNNSFNQLTGWTPNTHQHIPQPVAGVNVMLLPGDEKGIHHRCPLGTFVGTGEPIVLPPQRQRVDLVFDLVIVYLDAVDWAS